MSAAKVLIDSEEPGARMHEVTEAMVEFLLHGIGTET
jgi:hypothetical protein